MRDDAELLREFVESHSENAFRELVTRYIDLVYAAAARRCGGDSHRAADVAQDVFIRLAHNARKLTRHPALGAWLHTATRNVAINAMISDQRRRDRENAALLVSQQDAVTDAGWDRIRPELDDAIDALIEPDRTAIVLRYLQARSFADIGTALNVTADAARMRTKRALERLRIELAKRGITSTAAALGTLATHAAMAAPPGLVSQIVQASVGMSGAALTASITMSSLKLVGIAAIAGLAFLAGTWVNGRHATVTVAPAPTVASAPNIVAETRKDDDQLKQRLDQTRAENTKLRAEADDVRRQLTVALQPPAPGAFLPVSEQERHIMNNLRQVSSARDQYIREHGHAPASLAELVGLEPEKYVRFLNSINGENYSGLALSAGQPLTVTTKDGVTVTYDESGGQTTKIPKDPPDPAALARMLKVDVGSFSRAWTAYQAAHNNALPNTPEALIPYFATPKEGADYVDALEARKSPRK
jgi:RNA polymerase sigma factor (sigma-70 family)